MWLGPRSWQSAEAEKDRRLSTRGGRLGSPRGIARRQGRTSGGRELPPPATTLPTRDRDRREVERAQDAISLRRGMVWSSCEQRIFRTTRSTYGIGREPRRERRDAHGRNESREVSQALGREKSRKPPIKKRTAGRLWRAGRGSPISKDSGYALQRTQNLLSEESSSRQAHSRATSGRHRRSAGHGRRRLQGEASRDLLTESRRATRHNAVPHARQIRASQYFAHRSFA